jgi:hypothetical protein
MQSKQNGAIGARNRAASRGLETKNKFVFLGGTCGNSDWRKPFITLLEETGTPYFDPQLPSDVEWTAKHASKEKQQLSRASIVVIMITNATTGIVSLLEFCELLTTINADASSQKVLLAYIEEPKEAKAAGSQSIADKDRRRAIEFLRQRVQPPRTVVLNSADDLLREMALHVRA